MQTDRETEFFLRNCFIYNSNTYITYSTSIIHKFTVTQYLLVTPLILTLLIHALLYNTVLKKLKGNTTTYKRIR